MILTDVFTSVSLRRKVIIPYTFSDGTQIVAGQWLCAPQRAIMRDPVNYPEATTFKGFRFANDDATRTISKLIDTESRFLYWGLGKRAWLVTQPYFIILICRLPSVTYNFTCFSYNP